MYIIIPFMYEGKLYTCSMLRKMLWNQGTEIAGTRLLLCYKILDHSNCW